MRTLMIRPDHPDAPLLIRSLERNHPEAVASPRRDWLMRGPEALALADEPGPSPEPIDRDDRLAHADPAEPAPARRPPAQPASSEPAPTPEPIPPQSPADEPASSSPPPADPDREKASHPSPADRAAEPAARSAGRSRAPVTYLFTANISRKDKRYPKKAEAVDGLSVKVSDTDSDPDADLEIYLDGKRIRRIRNGCVGQQIIVAGRSGRRYGIVIRDITDETETVRFSVRRVQ
jgi:hypothetical protein